MNSAPNGPTKPIRVPEAHHTRLLQEAQAEGKTLIQYVSGILDKWWKDIDRKRDRAAK